MATRHADADLFVLIETWKAAHQRQAELNERADSIMEQYRDAMPPRPAILRWRITDPCGYEVDPKDGKYYCARKDLERLVGAEHHLWMFQGTSEEYGKLPADHSIPFLGPKPEFAHLYKSSPLPENKKRADQIIAAFAQWDAQCDALSLTLGKDEAIDQADEAVDEALKALDAVEARNATTIAGLKAKAGVYVLREYDGDLPSLEDDEYDAEYNERTLISIMRDIANIE